MKCPICRHGETMPGQTTILLERDGMVLVIQDVPARVCDNCGERYVDEDVAARLLQWADTAVHAGVKVEVRTYVAA